MQTPEEQTLESVTGVGGVFIKAVDPDALTEWYAKNLGIKAGEYGTEFLWRHITRPEEIGRTVWSLFPKDSDYFGPTPQPVMINYRVENLERLLEQLRRNGVAIIKVDNADYGDFAWVADPEGNRIELWQPKGESVDPKSPPVTVTAIIKAQPGKEAELKEELLTLIAPTRKEEGCLNYDLHQDADDATNFVFHENWASRAHLEMHLQSEHLKAVVAKAGGLMAEPPKIIVAAKIA